MNRYIIHFKSGMEPITIESNSDVFKLLKDAWENSKNLTITMDQPDVQVMIRMSEVVAISCSKF